MLDLTNLLTITDGDKELIDELIKTFLETTKEDIKKLELAIEKQQIKEASQLAHRIKGGAAIVGAKQLYLLTEDLEQSPKQSFTENSTTLKDVKNSFQSIEKSYFSI